MAYIGARPGKHGLTIDEPAACAAPNSTRLNRVAENNHVEVETLLRPAEVSFDRCGVMASRR
jgi:hypothetical protein